MANQSKWNQRGRRRDWLLWLDFDLRVKTLSTHNYPIYNLLDDGHVLPVALVWETKESLAILRDQDSRKTQPYKIPNQDNSPNNVEGHPRTNDTVNQEMWRWWRADLEKS